MRLRIAVVEFALLLCPAIIFAGDRSSQGSIGPGPILASNFQLEINSTPMSGIMSCDGFGTETEVIEQKMVTPDGHQVIRKVPGATRTLDIVCVNGFTSDMYLWNWRADVENGNMTAARRPGSLILKDSQGAEAARFDFTNAWPSSLKFGGVNGASTNSTTETVTIVIDTLDRVR